MVESQLTIPQF